MSQRNANVECFSPVLLLTFRVWGGSDLVKEQRQLRVYVFEISIRLGN